jgi:hypothetical protein
MTAVAGAIEHLSLSSRTNGSERQYMRPNTQILCTAYYAVLRVPQAGMCDSSASVNASRKNICVFLFIFWINVHEVHSIFVLLLFFAPGVTDDAHCGSMADAQRLDRVLDLGRSSALDEAGFALLLQVAVITDRNLSTSPAV